MFAGPRAGRTAKLFLWISVDSVFPLNPLRCPVCVVTSERGYIEREFTPPMAGYLVDPASSHMLVSKIKPCMSKYKPH